MRQKGPFWQTGDSKTAGAEDKRSEQERRRGPFLNDQEDPLNDKDLQIAQWVQKMPDLEPPSDLLTSVMQSLQPKKRAWM